MKTIPHLTEADIRPLATAQSWTRGEDYYHSNYVENVLWRDGLLTAEVEGSEYEPYIVQVKFDEQKISSTDCTCPYDWAVTANISLPHCSISAGNATISSSAPRLLI